MKKANVKILKTVAVVFGVASVIVPCVLLASVLGSNVIQSDEVSGAIVADAVQSESSAAPSQVASETASDVQAGDAVASVDAQALADAAAVAVVIETSAPERLDFSALITNPGKNTLIALSMSGNNYGKWEQDQNGDMFFVFSGSKRSGNVATNGWYAIQDKEVDERIVASPSDKVLAQIISGKRTANLSDAEITKIVGGRTFSWYHFDSEGKLQTGWFRDGKDTYFLSEDEDTKGKMIIGEKVINGSTYMFSDNPEMLGVLQ